MKTSTYNGSLKSHFEVEHRTIFVKIVYSFSICVNTLNLACCMLPITSCLCMLRNASCSLPLSAACRCKMSITHLQVQMQQSLSPNDLASTLYDAQSGGALQGPLRMFWPVASDKSLESQNSDEGSNGPRKDPIARAI